jgi:hypothetical protein
MSSVTFTLRPYCSPQTGKRATFNLPARLTIEKIESGGPRLVRWKPFPGVAVRASTRFSGDRLPETGQPADPLHEGAD